MTFRRLLLCCVMFSAPALAADGGASDASTETPDGSAGNGGSQNMTQEGDEDMMGGACMLTRDCSPGFACVGGTCKYVGYRQAETGCNAAPALTLLGLGATLAFLRRRRS